MKFTICLTILLTSLNISALEMIVLKNFKCNLANITISKIGYPKKHDEGYYPLQVKIKNKTLVLGDLLVQQNVKGSLCSEIPVLRVGKSKILIVSSDDNRPFGSNISLTLLNTLNGEILNKYKGNQLKSVIYKDKKIYFTTSVARSDSMSGSIHTMNGKDHTFLEEEIHKVYNVIITKENEIKVSLDLKKTFESEKYKYLFKDFSAFKKEFEERFGSKASETWIYILFDKSSKKASCYYMNAKRKYYKEIDNWKCL